MRISKLGTEVETNNRMRILKLLTAVQMNNSRRTNIKWQQRVMDSSKGERKK
jgi:hypothetical protein